MKIVKIKEVLLYVGSTETQECLEVKAFLSNQNIPFTALNYGDVNQHEDLFKALSTWTFGRLDKSRNITLSDFPFVTWRECYDDFEQSVEIATSVSELITSTLVSNKALIL